MDFEEKVTTDQLFSRTRQRKHLFIKKQIVAGLMALIFCLLFWFKVFEPLEFFFLDRWLSRAQWKTETSVVLVSITDKSIQAVGKWPWNPSRYISVLELLSSWGVQAIYIDHAFSEKRTEQELQPLVDFLKKRKTPVFFAADLLARKHKSGKRSSVGGEAPIEFKMEWARPVKEIMNEASFGHRGMQAGSDRVFRFWQPWERDSWGRMYALASLTMMMDLKSNFRDRALLRSAKREMRLIPWNRVRFETWPRVEFSDLMQSSYSISQGVPSLLSTAFFQNKVVFIGLASETHMRSGLTPWRENVYPYESLAAVFDGLGKSDWKFRSMAPFWFCLPPFALAAGLLIFWTGARAGARFWMGWFSLIGMVVILWAGFAFFQIWFPFAALFLFLLAAGFSLFVFELISSAGERSVLFHLATRDGLTNLYTIRHFRLIMNQATREAVMRKESLSMILIDIDYFKKINDTYGHPAGDMVIKKIAEVIQSCIRQKRAYKDVDFVARYGGEEFIVLLRRCSLQDAAELVAERIRRTIGQTHFEWQLKRLFVTVSLGVATLRDGENIPDPVVHRADKALYRAKESGRNRVCVEGS